MSAGLAVATCVLLTTAAPGSASSVALAGPSLPPPSSAPAGPAPSDSVAPVSAPASTHSVIRGAGYRSAIKDQYIVVLKDDSAVRRAGIAGRARRLVSEHKGRLGHIYDRSGHGFSAAMSEAEATRLAADPDVAYVEQDQLVHVADTEESPTWNLDRIDQHALPVDNTYSYDPAASNVNVYVIDTGIRITNTDFGGRGFYGWDFVDNDSVADDCNGHGTNVAGIIGGDKYGVAKSVHLVSVRVLDCNGFGSISNAEAGINWVIANAVKPAVVSMSVEFVCTDANGAPIACASDFGSSENAAMANAVASGLTFVVAAGNHNINACGAPQARTATAITVGASDSTDHRWTGSNWGSCVDIYAPGVNVLSDGNASDTGTSTMTGTSQATPHVAGAAALILARPGWATNTPAQVKAQLISESTKNALIGLDAGSPNRLLYTPAPPISGGTSIAVSHNDDGRLDVFGVNQAGALFYRSQTAVNQNTWSAWHQSVDPNWYSVCAQKDSQTHIEVLGLRRNQEIWHRTQAFVNSDSWSQWNGFDGQLTSCAEVTGPARLLEVYGTTAQGQVRHRTQVTAGTTDYTPWQDLVFPGVARTVTAQQNTDGIIDVFALNTAGQIWHTWQTGVGSATYTPWVQLDGTLTSIAAGRNSNGTIELFGANSQGNFFHRDSNAGTNSWQLWQEIVVPDSIGKLHSLATDTQVNGDVAVFAVNTAGQIWHAEQQGPSASRYSDWVQLDGTLRP
jgi:subtilisin family serine protease